MAYLGDFGELRLRKSVIGSDGMHVVADVIAHWLPNHLCMRYSRRTALLPRFANGAAFYLHHASKVIGRQAEVTNFTCLTGRNLFFEQSC